ncbi:hypothetical protein LAUMK4_03525 [Mycobacterium persicum]|uniref:Uncharacterized protein n=1 Tax=Mycobacterium persicum TaxID=1487726 RepID=A0AB38UWD8_9MYCO|nr:hypothetical protein LAUMK22_03401 [Mycobacterium kansasii]VAZ77636.1 hypothetical protein LAUMK15_03926 [Mycobacterium persicum]VAZ84753.1 hypothetical protein LAUMK42_03578 [Mycobacterium persicum]VAZ96513.1 hypothetical protein LAUMK4_03525 [Mycobacterium persicum]
MIMPNRLAAKAPWKQTSTESAECAGRRRPGDAVLFHSWTFGYFRDRKMNPADRAQRR